MVLMMGPHFDMLMEEFGGWFTGLECIQVEVMMEGVLR